jgi:uracil-DNA glycosylase
MKDIPCEKKKRAVEMNALLREVRNCRECEQHLPMGANPVFSASAKSKIIIIGQAPGRVVHFSKIPWSDKSGDNLRNWLGVDRLTFYDDYKIALIPMGFCYPGTGKTGDLPPRSECAPMWHGKLLKMTVNVNLILLVGHYAQKYYLGDKVKNTLTETVRNYNAYLPKYFPLPHPSPRNNIWQAKNEWFGNIVLPELKMQIQAIL